MQPRDGDAPYRDPWAGGVLTLSHHPRVLRNQRIAHRHATGELPAGSVVALWIAALAVYALCFVAASCSGAGAP